MTKQITLEEALKLVSFKQRTVAGKSVNSSMAISSAMSRGSVGGTMSWRCLGQCRWFVNGNVDGYVIYANVGGCQWRCQWQYQWQSVGGNVMGNVYGDVDGNVRGTINGREWESVETPKDKLQRLIEESGNQELIDTFNQLEDN